MPGYDYLYGSTANTVGGTGYTSYGGNTNQSGGNQGGPGHPGGYNPNLNPPVTVDYTSDIVDTGNDQDTSVSTVNEIIGTEVIPEIPGQTENEKVWELATMEASNPKYELSYEGQKLKGQGILPGSDQWVQYFGMPSVVATNKYGEPILTKGQWDEWGNEIASPDKYLYTGLGQTLLDQYDEPGDYETKKGDYWKTRTEQEQSEDRQQQQRQYGYFPDPGGGYRGRGYAYGDTEMFDTDVRNYWRDVAGTPMLPVAGSGAGASMAAADELYSLAAGNKAFSNTPAEQGILAILNA